MTGKALVIFQGFPGAVGTLHEPQNGPWSNKKKSQNYLSGGFYEECSTEEGEVISGRIRATAHSG